MNRCGAWGLVLAGALGAWACSSDSTGVVKGDGDPKPAGGAGGEGGRSEPTGCREAATCESFGNCSTLEELEADCDIVERVAYRSTCGGTYVEELAGVTATVWVFDADGSPIGASYEGEGSCSSWGEDCGRVGTGVPLCNAPVDCTEHASCAEWGANFACPLQLGDAADICGLGGVEVTRSASDCGGTLVHATNGIQDVQYSFDAGGKLIGVISNGDVGDCDRWGTACRPSGTPQTVCGEGGEGGGGGGGGGGGEGGAG